MYRESFLYALVFYGWAEGSGFPGKRQTGQVLG